jgi:hypothetical protein
VLMFGIFAVFVSQAVVVIVFRQMVLFHVVVIRRRPFSLPADIPRAFDPVNVKMDV